MSSETMRRWERWLYIVILVLALISRFAVLGDRAISHDESIHTKFSWNLYSGAGFQHNPMMHGPLLFEATALTYWLFGVNDFTSRIFVAALGVLLVMTPVLFRRWLGRMGAIATAVLLLLSPSISYYSRYIRHDVPLMITAVLLLWVILRFLESGKGSWLAWLAAVFSLMYATKEASYIYTAIFAALLFLPFAWQVFAVRWERERLYRPFVVLIALGIVLGLVFVAAMGQGELSHVDLDESGHSRATNLLIPLWGRIAAVAAMVVLGAALVMMRRGVGEAMLRQLPLFDVLMVVGTLTLPLGTAFLIKFAAGVDMDIVYEAVRTGNFGSVPTSAMVAIVGVTAATLVLSIAFGLWWDRKRWPRIALIHYTIFIVLYTTVFTWAFGALSGLIGGLAYWLAQQGVRRGDQPGYYYLFIGSLYEYLAITLSGLGAVAALAQVVRAQRSRVSGSELKGGAEERVSSELETEPPSSCEDESPRGSARPGLELSLWFPLFLLGWTVASWAAYTLAGEKMPWLLVHITLPSVFLGGWGIGRMHENLSWGRLPIRAVWISVAALPLTGASLVVLGANGAALVRYLREGVSPAGLNLAQLNALGLVLGGLVGTLAFGAGLAWAVRQVGLRRSLGIAGLWLVAAMTALTLRTSIRLNFVTYDLATEFLVYAHGTPDIKLALEQVREVSWRETGSSSDVRVAYGEDGSWPFTWYMVEFPNNYFYSMTPDPGMLRDCPVVIAGTPQYGPVEDILGDDYVSFEYRYLWWPLQDYYGLTWTRIRDAVADADMRGALWDIVWRRDYVRYAQLKNPARPFTLTDWPYRKEFRLYVRRDVAEAIWPDARPAGLAQLQPAATPPPDPYGVGARLLDQVSRVSLPGAVLRGMAVASDGTIYVADTLNHRVWRVDGEGGIDSFGGYGADLGQFNEPWDVAIGAEGNIYVADTWNHRIQKFDADLRPLGSWGGIVQVTMTGIPTAQGLFYGPRGIALGPEGELFVADTGNKRVQVFDADGGFLREFGGWGSGPGKLDEPVGIAISSEGIVAVADTWNRRVQLFDRQGLVLQQWSVPSWNTDHPDDKPFVTWDASGALYVADALQRRVLAFDADGAFRWALSAAAGANLSFPQGLLVSDGVLYVTDAHGGEIIGYNLP